MSGDEARGVFVTGTDTGVGKTLVSAAIARCWRAAGTEVVYVKPVQSGDDDGDDDARDVAHLAPGVAVVTGTVLGPSLAPAVAARLLGLQLTFDELAGTVDAAAAAAPAARLVVEGAGGVLVELGTDGTTCADLARRVGLPVIVVARPGLGTLNHTAMTLGVLRERGLELAGVVVSGFPAAPGLATRTNLAEIDRLSDGRLVGVVPALQPDAVARGDALVDASTWFTATLGGTATRASLLALGA